LVDNKFHGLGALYDESSIYSGEFKFGMKNGFGKLSKI
jgi:hypothetical protein